MISFMAIIWLSSVVRSRAAIDDEDIPCCEDNCESYRGHLSVSVEGINCMPWHDLPTSHHNHPSKHPNSGLDSNYCRNPSEHEQAWCYVKVNGVRKWKNCDMRTCPSTTTPATTATTTMEPVIAFPNNHSWTSEERIIRYKGAVDQLVGFLRDNKQGLQTLRLEVTSLSTEVENSIKDVQEQLEDQKQELQQEMEQKNEKLKQQLETMIKQEVDKLTKRYDEKIASVNNVISNLDVTRCESGYMSVYVKRDTVHYFQKPFATAPHFMTALKRHNLAGGVHLHWRSVSKTSFTIGINVASTSAKYYQASWIACGH